MLVKTYGNTISRLKSANVELLECGMITGHHDWCHPTTSVYSPFNRLYFVESGGGYLFSKDQRFEMRPGFVYLTPAYYSFGFCCPKAIEKLYFHFNFKMSSGKDIFDGYNNFIGKPISMEKIKLLKKMMQSENYADIMNFKYLVSQEAAMLLELSGIDDQSAAKYSSLIQRTFDYAVNNLSAQLKVSDIAKKLSVSESTLFKRFKAEVGLSIQAYLEALLLNQARQLLVTTEKSIKQIATELEFSDPYYFSRYFKKRQLESPSDYRIRLKSLV